MFFLSFLFMSSQSIHLLVIDCMGRASDVKFFKNASGLV